MISITDEHYIFRKNMTAKRKDEIEFVEMRQII